jgi:hypothetical protein
MVTIGYILFTRGFGLEVYGPWILFWPILLTLTLGLK